MWSNIIDLCDAVIRAVLVVISFGIIRRRPKQRAAALGPVDPALDQEIRHLRSLVEEGRNEWALEAARQLLSQDRVRENPIALIRILNLAEMASYNLDDEEGRARFRSEAAQVVHGLPERRILEEQARADLRESLRTAEALIEQGYVFAENREKAEAVKCHELAVKILTRWFAFNEPIARERLQRREFANLREDARRLLRRATHNLADAWIREIHDGDKPADDYALQCAVEATFRRSLQLQHEEGRRFAITYVGLLELWEATGDWVAIQVVLEELLDLPDEEFRSLDFFDHLRRSRWVRNLHEDPRLAPYFERLTEKASCGHGPRRMKVGLSMLLIGVMLAGALIGSVALVRSSPEHSVFSVGAEHSKNLTTPTPGHAVRPEEKPSFLDDVQMAEKQMARPADGIFEFAEKQMLLSPNATDEPVPLEKPSFQDDVQTAEKQMARPVDEIFEFAEKQMLRSPSATDEPVPLELCEKQMARPCRVGREARGWRYRDLSVPGGSLLSGFSGVSPPNADSEWGKA